MTGSNFTTSDPLLLFEALESRMLLDSQVGAVTMPFDGYLSAAIYDSDGQLIRTLLAASPQQAGTVSLVWDGLNSIGQPVIQDGTYTWKALASQVEAVDQGGVGDTSFSPLTFEDADSDPIAVAVDIGSPQGDIGGIFARAQVDSYYGDTTLIDTYDLNDSITASGKFDVTRITEGWSSGGGSGLFVGHFSQNANNREFIGMEFGEEGQSTNSYRVRARFQAPNGVGTDASDWFWLNSEVIHTFSYIYDPNVGYGRLTLTIDGTTDLVANIRSVQRSSGASFDGFGMGVTSNQNGENDSTKTAKVHIDDVTYTGNTGLNSLNDDPGWSGSNNTANGNNYGWGNAASAGGVYISARMQEKAGFSRVDANGSLEWKYGSGYNLGIASDGQYVYLSKHGADNIDRIERYHVRGFAAPFTQAPGGYITVNSDPYPWPSGQSGYTVEQWRTKNSSWGIVVDGTRIFVSNYRNNRVDVYDAVTGLKLDVEGLAVTKPLGIAVESAGPTSGTIWVANNGDRVSRFTYKVSGGNYTFVEDTRRRISGLADPSGISIGGSSDHLFIAEMGTHGHIHQYDISSAPVLAGLQTLGTLDVSGPLEDNEFNFEFWAGIAVDEAGILNVVDDHRVLRFYTEGESAGTLKEMRHSEFAPMPVDTYGYGANGTHYLFSGRWEYEVDPEYTGGPRAGWDGNGSWRLTGRYHYNQYYEGEGAGVRRTLMDGATPRDFVYEIEGDSVIVYAIEATGIRRSAILGWAWRGTSRLEASQYGRWSWTDTDGDGQIDWNSQGYGSDGEVTWSVPLGQYAQVAGAPWVDDDGTVWLRGIGNSIVKIPVSGFDTQGNPVYDWANMQTAATYINDRLGFVPTTVRVAGNDDIYALGMAKVPAGDGWLNVGDWISRYDSNGNRLLLMPTRNWIYGAMAVDETDPEGKYFYAGYGVDDQHYIDMFTNDGLLVTVARFGEASGYSGGWIDNPWGIDAFTHPITGITYLYGEEVYYGKSVRYRVDNLDTIQRQEGTFEWQAPAVLGGRWEFENSVNDAVGTHNGAFYGGTATYAAGQIGNAIDLGGDGSVNDYVAIPYTVDPYQVKQYTLTAWVKPTDVSSVNIISRNRQISPNYVTYQLQINASGQFEHFVYDGGANKLVTGSTTAASNTWYHVAIVGSANGMARLYVNGQEQGTAVSIGDWVEGTTEQFLVGKDRPNQSMGYFDGLVDDVRIYEQALSGADILAIYQKKAIVSVTSPDASAAENGVDGGVFAIRRDDRNGALTVNYTITGTATSPTDYSTISSSVVIPDGQLSTSVTVTPIDDSTAEASETVILTLASGTGYAVDTPSSATVTIADNDSTGPSVTVMATDADAAESGGNTGTFTITRSNSTGSLTVYYTLGGTATSGSDYSALLGSVVISGGQTSATVTLTPIDDSVAEAGETAILTLSTDANYTVGWPGSATVNIADNEPVVTVTASDASASEEGDTATFTISRTATAGSLTVYYTVGGTATSGSDFSALSGSVVISSGQTSATVTLTPIDDSTVESDETVMLTLSANANYHVGSPGNASVSIADNEPTIAIAATDANAAEPGDTGTFTITRTTTAGSLTVYYTVGGTATNGSDYSALSGSVVIIDGSTSAAVVVTPTDDVSIENSESVICTLSSNSSYIVGPPSSAIVDIADNDGGPVNVDFNSDPGWTGTGNTANGNSYGYSSTDYAGGVTGEAGGTFAANGEESYYADTDLSRTFTLADVVAASGKVTVFGQVNANHNWVLGHISTSTSDYSTLGIELLEQDSSSFRFRAKVATPGGGGSTSGNIVAPNGDYNFEYTYDPSLGSYGRLTIRLFNATFNRTASVDLTSTARSGGSSFDAFGIGIMHTTVTPDPNRTVRMFVDDVRYTGFHDVDPQSVSVSTSDAIAVEQGFDSGTFTTAMYEEASAIVASDGFESGNGNGGTGWGGNWAFAGGTSVISDDAPASGDYHLRLTGSGGVASRAVGLAGLTSARLIFDWKAVDFEPGDAAVVDVYDGSIWTRVLTISDGQDDDVYHQANIDLSPYALTGSFQIRFRSLMNATDACSFIDNLLIGR